MYCSWRLRPPHAVIVRASRNRVDQSLRQFDLGGELVEPLRIELDQRFAQVLQRVHLGLAPGLRRRWASAGAAAERPQWTRPDRVARRLVLQFVGPWHRSGGNPERKATGLRQSAANPLL